MADTKTSDGKTLSVGSKTLSLKPRTETGVVRQSFSHGRSKQVVVEVKKRRTPGAEPKAPEVAPPPPKPAAKVAAPKPAATPAPAAPAPKPSGVVLRTLTDEERNRRAHALGDARLREAEERKIAEEEARHRAIRESSERAEREAAESRKREEDDRHKREEESKRKAGEVAKKRFGEVEATPGRTPGARPVIEAEEEEGPRTFRRGPGGGAARPVPPPKRPTRAAQTAEKARGRLTLVTALNADEVRERSAASFRRRNRRAVRDLSNEPKEKLIREVTIPEFISIADLANRMAERSVDVIKLLMKQGQMAQINDVIDADTAQLIAEELGHTVKRVSEADVEEGVFDAADDPAHLASRAPVVTVMGHVDHGKTSLLDAIRSTNVVSGEAGGITQHIGAYQVDSPTHGKITFIDTPGHAAFTAMRARGAKVTDIVVLVVAADDGVMPQTEEAINHAKAAGVSLVVAINKVDLPNANINRTRQQLYGLNVLPDNMGGDTPFVETSAATGKGIDELLDQLSVVAELKELKANPKRDGMGTCLEAMLSEGEFDGKKNASIDAQLKSWIELDGLNLKPAPQPNGDPRANGIYNTQFRAEGELESRDLLTFNIQAMVVDIRPNGNLVIEARKQIKVNEELQIMSLSGIVRREDIAPNNVVLSERIAELMVTKNEAGHVRDAYKRGWLHRVYDRFAPF
jgi:translation initiation factor IF-2